MAVTKSGRGTWGLGCGTWDVELWDVGTRGQGDVGTQGCEDAGMQGLGYVGCEHVQGLEDMGHRDWRT